MILTNNLTPDSACRTFLSNDISFVSFSNAILFDGKQVIHPERLVRYENDMMIQRVQKIKKEEEILSKKRILMVSIVFLVLNVKVRLIRIW